MPDYPTPRPASHNYTRNVRVGFVDYKGNTASGGFEGIDNTVSNAEVDTLRSAMGAISNAGIFYDKLEDDTEMAIQDAITHIDPHAEVSDKGVFKFVHPDNNYKDRYLEVPAIWGDKLLPGSTLLDLSDAGVQAVATAGLAVLNKGIPDGEPNWVLEKAYFSDRKGKSRSGDVTPNSRDPRNPAP